MMLAPVAVAVLGPNTGVMLVNLLAVGSSLLIIPSVWAGIDWRRLGFLMIAAVPGVVFGTWLAVVLDTAWLEITIGAMLGAGLIATLLLRRDGLPRERPGIRLLLGGAAGTMSATAGAGGPAILIYASVARWPFATLRATIQPYFAATALLAFFSKLIARPEDWPQLALTTWLALLVSLAAGAALAHLCSRHIPPAIARFAAYSIASCGALSAVARGILELHG